MISFMNGKQVVEAHNVASELVQEGEEQEQENTDQKYPDENISHQILQENMVFCPNNLK